MEVSVKSFHFIVVVLIIFSLFSIVLSNKMSHSSVQILVKSCIVSNLLLQLINVLTYAESYTTDKIVCVWFLIAMSTMEDILIVYC